MARCQVLPEALLGSSCCDREGRRKITHHSSRLGPIGRTGSIQIVKNSYKKCATRTMSNYHTNCCMVCTKQPRKSVPNRLQGRALKHKVALIPNSLLGKTHAHMLGPRNPGPEARDMRQTAVNSTRSCACGPLVTHLFQQLRLPRKLLPAIVITHWPAYIQSRRLFQPEQQHSSISRDLSLSKRTSSQHLLHLQLGGYPPRKATDSTVQQ